MKTIVLFIATTFTVISAKAQFSQNFENTDAALTGNCWMLTNITHSTDPADYITGSGSMITPALTGGFTTELITPALNVASTSFTVSFNYKTTSKINTSAFRTIEIGILNPAGAFTSLRIITLDHNSPATVQNYSETFTLGSTGKRKLVLRFDGTNGDGNTKIVVDDLSTSCNAQYGAGSCNSAPVAVNDIFIGIVSSPFSGNVITNDNEPDGESMFSSIVANSPNGTVTLQPNGNFTFVPNSGFSGSSTNFTYRLTDDGFAAATSNTATVTINFASGGSLPTKLISFTAMFNNGQADLKWTTATENNLSHFVVEKSIDGKNFSNEAIEFAFGNSTERKNYSFTDNTFSSQTAIIYYRIRSVDHDGKSDLSETRMIRIGKQNGGSISVLTYPNPVKTELRITIPASWQGKKLNYEVFGNNGQTVIKNEVVSSNQTETMNVSKLAPGFYLIKISCNNEIAEQKMIKQ